jgi:hypothetical protein
MESVVLGSSGASTELRGKFGRWWVPPAAVTLFAAVLYLATMPVRYASGESFTEYELAGADGRELIRPNHLFTALLNWLVLRAVPEGDERAGIIAIQAVQILAAVLAGLGLWRLLRRSGAAAGALAALLLVFFLARGVWMHASTVETGMIPLALLVGALAVLWQTGDGERDRLPLGTTAAAFAVFSLSVLFALYQVLLAPVLLAWLALRERRRRLAHLATAVGTMLLAGLVPYIALAAGLFGVDSVDGFVGWLTYHHDKEFLVGLMGIGFEGVLRSLSGLLNLLVDSGGAMPFVRLLLRGADPGEADLFALGRAALGGAVAAALLGLAVLGSGRDRVLALCCWAGLGITLLFGIVWLGSDPQFWLPAWPFCLLLAAMGAARLARTPRGHWVAAGGWTAAAVLLVVNLPVREPSLLLPSGGPQHRLAMELAPSLAAGDLILHPGANHGQSWVQAVHFVRSGVQIVTLVDKAYFREREAAGFASEVSRLIDERLRRGRRVYLDGFGGPLQAEQVGPWLVVESFRNCRRPDLLGRLAARYEIRDLAAGGNVAVVTGWKGTELPGPVTAALPAGR